MKIIAQRSDISAASERTLIREIKKIKAQTKLKISQFNITEKAYYLTVSKKSTVIPFAVEFLSAVDQTLLTPKAVTFIKWLNKKYEMSL